MDEEKSEKESETHIAFFSGKKIRRKLIDDKWFFSIVDIIGVLTDSENPRKYWNKLSQRLREEGSEVVTFCHQLKLIAEDGKLRKTDVVDTESVFRIIQSIPSKKAEPFKRWLAKVGYERIQEIENPELTQERMKKLYELKGYSKDWIDKRIRGIAIRQNLTDEWKNRGVEKPRDFAILTAEISKATFGMYPEEYKRYKKLQRENLRDHMTDLELIFSMLGEASTAEIERAQNPDNFKKHKENFAKLEKTAKFSGEPFENSLNNIEKVNYSKFSKEVSIKGGNIARNARIELEDETGESVVSEENFLEIPEIKKRKRRKKILEVENEKRFEE